MPIAVPCPASSGLTDRKLAALTVCGVDWLYWCQQGETIGSKHPVSGQSTRHPVISIPIVEHQKAIKPFPCTSNAGSYFQFSPSPPNIEDIFNYHLKAHPISPFSINPFQTTITHLLIVYTIIMRFATICTLISFLATPLAIIAAPAPAPAAAALANPEAHGWGRGKGHGSKSWGSYGQDDEDNNRDEGDDRQEGFGPSPTGLNSQGGLAGINDNDNDNDNDNNPRPAPTLLPGGTGNGNANANGNLGAGAGEEEEEEEEEEVEEEAEEEEVEEEAEDQGALGDDASATTTSNGPEATD
ncbi:MAG: hypothetical protein LQ337_000437 [Flavoplaca oasis]|nr:MAG: hypothetical protein LQ337_000437 [Flavoplaca oasis]